MKLLRKAIPTFLLVGMATALYADDAPKAAPATEAKSEKTETKLKPLTPPQARARAEAIVSQLNADYQQVLRLKEVARKANDVIKLNCVNDKLVQVKAQQNIADNYRTSIVAAGEDQAQVNSLRGEMEGVAGTTQRLREDAAACIGEPELFKQETGVDVQGPEIPDDPGTIDPAFPADGVDVEPPGYASPYS